MLAGQVERLDAVAGAERSVAVRLLQVVEELHVELVVFHDQDGFGHPGFLRVAGRNAVRGLPTDTSQRLTAPDRPLPEVDTILGKNTSHRTESAKSARRSAFDAN